MNFLNILNKCIKYFQEILKYFEEIERFQLFKKERNKQTISQKVFKRNFLNILKKNNRKKKTRR